jgi:hypothetical protein
MERFCHKIIQVLFHFSIFCSRDQHQEKKNFPPKKQESREAEMDKNKARWDEVQQKFKELTVKPVDDQMEFFLKSFIFALEDNWKEVVNLCKTFQIYIKNAGEGKEDLNVVQAADFLQKNGHERTALQRKEEIQDVDLDFNGRVAFIEYLLLHYKAMILTEYYKRIEEECKFNLAKGGVGVTGVGFQLLDELFTLPVGLDPELEKAIEEFTAKKKTRETKMKDLNEKSAQGGVKGLAAKNEIEHMQAQDSTEMNRLEITLNAAKKKAAKSSGEVALAAKKKKEEEEERKKRDEGRSKIKGIAAAWENK